MPAKHGSKASSSPKSWGKRRMESPPPPPVLAPQSPRGGDVWAGGYLEKPGLERFPDRPVGYPCESKPLGSRSLRCFGGHGAFLQSCARRWGAGSAPPPPPLCRYTGHAGNFSERGGGQQSPKRGGRQRGSPLQALPQRLHNVASAIRRETMSDSEFQHIIVQAIIKHQFDTLTHTHRALPSLQPQRAEQPLPFPAHKEASTKGHGRVRIENRNNKKTPLGS